MTDVEPELLGRAALPGKAEVGYTEVARGTARSTDGFNAFRG